MLRRKMIRDITKNISEYITIFLMILIGIMAYTGIESYMIGMEQSAKNYYKKYNLEDLNVYGNLEEKDLEKIKKLKYVDDAEGKLTIKVDNKSFKNHKIELNFINTNDISKMYLVSGEKYNKNKSGLWLDSYYAKNNNIKVGDKLKLSYGNLSIKEEVKGLINVPDHVYDVKDEAELFPAHLDYGYAYLSFKELKSKEKYSSIMIDTNNIKKVRKEIEKNIDKPLVFTKVEDSLSYSNYQGEIDEGKTYVGIFSGLFIFIAILSVVTTMTRKVKKERKEIGLLKALGFGNGRITFNYISYGIFISIIASILGALLGYFLIGKSFMNMEMTYYEVPEYFAGMSNKTYLVIILVTIVISLAIYLVTRKTLNEAAADLLKDERPKVKKNSLDFTKKFKNLSFNARWNIRDIIRNKFRTIMGLVGIIGTVALIFTAFGMKNTMDNYLKTELDVINNYKYKMTIKENKDDLINKYGSSESIGIEIKKGTKVDSNNLFINNTDGNIRVLDENLKEIKSLKDNGVYITRKLARTKGYKVGDIINWHIYGDKKYYKSKIVGLTFDPQNQNMTASKKYIESLGIKYNPDTLYTKNNTKPKDDGILTLQSISSVKSGINKMLETINSMILLLVSFACILGIVIIYNMSTLSFIEKNYQFATLKVLGFSDKKIKKIFITQNIWITIIGIIIGLPIGYKVVDYIFKEAIAENYDFFANINFETYIISVIGTIIISYLVSIIVANKVKKIDMVKSLKASE